MFYRGEIDLNWSEILFKASGIILALTEMTDTWNNIPDATGDFTHSDGMIVCVIRLIVFTCLTTSLCLF